MADKLKIALEEHDLLRTELSSAETEHWEELRRVSCQASAMKQSRLDTKQASHKLQQSLASPTQASADMLLKCLKDLLAHQSSTADKETAKAKLLEVNDTTQGDPLASSICWRGDKYAECCVGKLRQVAAAKVSGGDEATCVGLNSAEDRERTTYAPHCSTKPGSHAPEEGHK